jgi:hypothetical protein
VLSVPMDVLDVEATVIHGDCSGNESGSGQVDGDCGNGRIPPCSSRIL